MKNHYEQEFSTMELHDCLLSVFSYVTHPRPFWPMIEGFLQTWIGCQVHFILARTKESKLKRFSLCEHTLSVSVPTCSAVQTY